MMHKRSRSGRIPVALMSALVLSILAVSAIAWIVGAPTRREGELTAPRPTPSLRQISSVEELENTEPEIIDRSPATEDLEHEVADGDVDPHVAWAALAVSIPVRVDTNLEKTGPVRALPRHGHDLELVWDLADSTRYGEFELLEDGTLQLVDGTTDGYGGAQIEIHLRARVNAIPAAEVAVHDFGDAGPPFEFVWTKCVGEIVLSANRWKRGDLLVIGYDMHGEREGYSRSTDGRLVFVVS